MPASSVTVRFRLMHLVEVNLTGSGITSTIEEGTLCMFRPVYDKPSATTYGMSSAVHILQRGPCFRRLYCVEQNNDSGELVKFNVRLTDENKVLLGEWDLDISHGLHTHPVENGTRSKNHIPFAGDVAAMALDIVKTIKAGIELASNNALEQTRNG